MKPAVYLKTKIKTNAEKAQQMLQTKYIIHNQRNAVSKSEFDKNRIRSNLIVRQAGLPW